MAIHYDIEQDTLYLRGFKKGYEDSIKKLRDEAEDNHTRSFIKNLLTMTDMPNEKIARFARVSVEYVQKVKLEIEITKKKDIIHKRSLY